MSRRPTHYGHDELTPLVLGDVNDADAVLVEGTGLFLAVRKGDRRWVTGTAVRRGLASGSLIQVLTGREPAMTPEQLAAVDDTHSAPPEARPVAPADSSLAELQIVRVPNDGPVTVSPMAAAPRVGVTPKAAPKKKAAPRKR